MVINSGDSDCAGRNAVNLFTQTSHWLWGFIGKLRGGELKQRYPPPTHAHTHIAKTHFISPVVQNIHKNVRTDVYWAEMHLNCIRDVENSCFIFLCAVNPNPASLSKMLVV